MLHFLLEIQLVNNLILASCDCGGAWQFRWGFPMRLSQRIQFGLDECRRALAGAGRWLPPLVLATDGRLKNSIIPH